MKIEITKAQLQAIIDLKDDCHSMVGGGDAEVDRIWSRNIMLIDRMLKKNKTVSTDTKSPQQVRLLD